MVVIIKIKLLMPIMPDASNFAESIFPNKSDEFAPYIHINTMKPAMSK